MASVAFKIAYLFFALVALPQALASTDPIMNEALTGHNSFRALHGASPLVWNDDLAAAANNWASGCVFEHSGGQVGAFGGMSSNWLSPITKDPIFQPSENLAVGTDPFTITDGINMWTGEAGDYDPKNPTYSHFTQVVWKGTTELGCAFVTCPPGSIYPTEYGVRTLSPTFTRQSNLWASYRTLSSLRASITHPATLMVNTGTPSVPLMPRLRT